MKKKSVIFATPVVFILFRVFAPAASLDVSNIVLTPGRTESELNFAWQTGAGAAADARMQVALKSDMTGADFPGDKAQTFTGKSADFADGLTSHKATVNGLAASTGYVYRLGTGHAGEWSEFYEFFTRDVENFSVLLVGDAQIGDGNIDDNVAGWRDTLDKALQKVPDASFILSVGDQIKSSSAQEEYNGLLSLSQFKNLPFVPAIGNHDNNDLFSYHFNVPNESFTQGRTEAGGNYYFVHGNSLFIVINSCSTDYSRHKTFIRDAVKKHGEARWRIVMMHHSIYGADIARSTTLDMRKNFVPIFNKYRIDAVLSGHDHIYVRTRFMLKNQAVQPLEKFPARSTPPAEIPAGAVIKPEGTLYLAAASSSGSKYYDPASQFFDYLAERSAPYVPMFSQINITGASFEIITYRADTMDAVDRFVMVKAAAQGGLCIIVVIALAAAAVFVIMTFCRIVVRRSFINENEELMKKITVVLLGVLMFTGTGLFAGSLDHLSNQSAKWVMTTSRNASTDGADIVQYNPAGTAWLAKGLHLDASGQTLFKYYNNSETLKQDKPTPILPNAYLAYNFGETGPGKLAAYMQVGVGAGGGELHYKNGTAGTTFLLNSISYGYLGALPISSQEFTASSIYYGIGAGVSYAFPHDKVSVSFGGRAVMATRSFELAASFSAPNTALNGKYEYKAKGFTPIIGVNVKPNSDFTLSARFELPTSLEFEYKQKELGGDLKPIAVGALASAGIVDGNKFHQDLPAVIGLGAGYNVNDRLTLDLSATIYMLSGADLGNVYENGVKTGEISDYFSTGWEIGFGGTYQVLDKLKIGAGIQYAEAGAKETYLNDPRTALNASANPMLDSITPGVGAVYAIRPNMDLNLSFLWSHYLPENFSIGSGPLKVSGEYSKNVYIFAYGISYKF